MWKTFIIVLFAANFVAVFSSDAATYDYSDSSSSFSSSRSQSYSSVSSGTKETAESNCDGRHEYYEYCESRKEFVDDSCVIGCRCENNYVRNDKGKCVSKNKFCRRHFETFSDCINGGCDRRNCSDLKRPALCIDVVQGSCIQGCVCKKGYLRNVQGNCVPVNHCPERKDAKCRDVNEYYEDCASNSNCQTSCIEGCKCVLGYVRNDNGECVVDNGQYTTTTTTTATTSTTMTPTTAAPSQPTDANADEAAEKIIEGNTIFSLKFLQIKATENPNTSFIASPFSVLPLLAELALYTTGQSYEQLSSLLNVDSKDEIRQGMRKLLDNFKLPKNVTLTLAQKVYANKQFELSDNFKRDTEVYFDGTAENLDFSQQAEAAKTINDWVKAQTNGLIPNLVDQSMLSEMTRLVLVNAIYFKANWFKPFDPKNTQKTPFYVTKDRNVTVDMMHQKGYFKYMEDSKLEIKALEMLYKDRDYSILFVLPTSTTTFSIDGMVQSLQDPKTFKYVMDQMQNQEVIVSVPSIKTSTTTDLTKIFKDVNVTGILNPENKDIDGILKVYEQIYVSTGVQKGVVTIDETGSEAAAANAVVISTRALPLPNPDPKIFEANRPYAYFISHKRIILFCGSFNGT